MTKFNPELPWGSWMVMKERRGLVPNYLDPRTGETWRSVREAFWVGRLGMTLENDNVPTVGLELLHAALAAHARRFVGLQEISDDLYGGNRMFAGWHSSWLRRTGLTARTSETGSPLTAEGWSVLLMLIATRPHPVATQSPSAATVRQLSELGLGPEDRQARFARLEEAGADWDRVFVRQEVGRQAAIVLVGRGRGPMPVRQTEWMMRFASEDQRDVLFDWFCQRLDRWHDWGEYAARFSAQELTRRLLSVMAASLADVESLGRQIDA